MGPGPGPMGPMDPGPGPKGSWNALNIPKFPKSSFMCLGTSEVTRTQDPHQQMRNESRSYDAKKTNLRKEWFGSGQMVKSGKGK